MVAGLAIMLATSALAELSIDTYPRSLGVGEGDKITFSCDLDDLLIGRDSNGQWLYGPYSAHLTVMDDFGNPSSVLKLQRLDENDTPTGAAGSFVFVPMYTISDGVLRGVFQSTVYVIGTTPGAAYVSVAINGSYSLPQSVHVSVVAPDMKFRSSSTGEVTDRIVVGESDVTGNASFYLPTSTSQCNVRCVARVRRGLSCGRRRC